MITDADLAKAARYYGCSPEDLAEQSIEWVVEALVADEIEREAEKAREEREADDD